MNSCISSQVSRYYTSMLEKHGETPQGVDWNGAFGQRVRFEQLMKVVDSHSDFSINDLGCGYGSLLEFLNDEGRTLQYCGIDLSEKMIEAAKQRHKNTPNSRFVSSHLPDRSADYTVASGIFNVKLDTPSNIWLEYILETLDQMNRFSIKGFAFNCLTSFSDREKMKEDLYYADPTLIFNHCKNIYAKNVALLHDYNMYEFTIIVRKS